VVAASRSHEASLADVADPPNIACCQITNVLCMVSQGRIFASSFLLRCISSLHLSRIRPWFLYFLSLSDFIPLPTHGRFRKTTNTFFSHLDSLLSLFFFWELCFLASLHLHPIGIEDFLASGSVFDLHNVLLASVNVIYSPGGSIYYNIIIIHLQQQFNNVHDSSHSCSIRTKVEQVSPQPTACPSSAFTAGRALNDFHPDFSYPFFLAAYLHAGIPEYVVFPRWRLYNCKGRM
jgi:hypothetical protein